MCGARTADLNEINLGPGAKKFRNQRLKRGLAEYNLRILVSGSGTLDPRAEIFRHSFSPILILTTRRASAAKIKKLRALAAEVKICGAREINWPRTLRWLREKWKVQRLLCEGGGELNDALFRARLVDELHLTVCPKIFGGRHAPTIAEGIGLGKLSAAENFELKSAKRVAAEIFLTFRKQWRLPATRNSPA
jgi:riboflavin-specific deaminase-like protein